MMQTPRELTIAEYNNHFTEWWNRVFTEYKERKNCIWLAGPTSYVFSLDDVKFAVDLQVRRSVDLEKVRTRLMSDVSEISFILITHQHDDHMCIPLMRELANTDIIWYIPYGTREDLIKKSLIKKENIIWVKDGDCWEIGQLKFRAFKSPHTKPGEAVFLQCGYEIQAPEGKILISGDIRDYEYEGFPEFGDVDLCFAHLWAGNDALNSESYMPLLKQFVECHASFAAKKYFLCHLYEIGREDKYLWHSGHAELAKKMFHEILPESVIEVPNIGDRICMDLQKGK